MKVKVIRQITYEGEEKQIMFQLGNSWPDGTHTFGGTKTTIHTTQNDLGKELKIGSLKQDWKDWKYDDKLNLPDTP